MASARAALGKARRSMIKRKKTTGIVTGALSTLGTVAAFGAGQAKKADTAWKEYEAGYKELGGEGFERPKFGQKGYFKGPEGDVRIDEKVYDRGQIQKAGRFLGSDASQILDEGQRQDYIDRQGTLATGKHLGDYLQEKYQVESSGTIATRRNVPASIQKKRDDYQDALIQFPEGQNFPPAPSYKQMAENNPLTITPLYDDAPPDLGTQNIKKIDPQEMKTSLFTKLKGYGRDIGRNIEQGFIEGEQYNQEVPWDQQVVQKEKDISAEPTSGPPRPSWLPSLRFARGGDFITNGPQKIVVGDNASGRERVSIRPLPSKKDEAKLGRYGDDAMKIIDGQPAHIDSSIEGDMSPEDIKKYGAGTINPITGKKEYFLGAIAGALAIGSSLYKGYQATQNQGDIDTARTAAGDIQQEQLDLVGSQYTTGMQELGLGTRMQATDIQTSGYGTISKQNLATSPVEDKMQAQMKTLLEGSRTTAQKIQDTKTKGTMAIEDAYQSTLTGLESQPGASGNWRTNFLEGVFS